MYKASIRALLRRCVKKLNEGDPSLLLKMAAPDAQLTFPGYNSWAAMYRPVVKGREQHITHRGFEECKGFAQRFVDRGIQFSVEDVLVNGPPWKTRIALRVVVYIPGPTPGSDDEYNNRATAFLGARWGRLVSWEDYEDTERVAEWDAAKQGAVS
ncbi:hypothetical protein BH10ACT2_BH10ACT2_27720 [soil metagenome]